MYGPYSAQLDQGRRIISYRGNRRYAPKENVTQDGFGEDMLQERMAAILSDPMFAALHSIDDAIFTSAVTYFKSISAKWCNLPLTTLMISSPGEVYAGRTLNYTTDTLPIELDWFDTKRKVFLSESSQFYLELFLLMNGVDKVFSIYNSFRKESCDFCHLSEFQHIEFEGHVDFDQNINIACNLLDFVTRHVAQYCSKELSYFLDEKDIQSLSSITSASNFRRVPCPDALEMLLESTGDIRYRDFTLKHFGGWEEIKLTELLGAHVILTEAPLLEIPFYHNEMKTNPKGKLTAENADLLLYGYREVIGSGVRIKDPACLAEKAKVFKLPEDDYRPYIESRTVTNYKTTAGFGMGWQRYTQWLLKMPHIWDVTPFPRGHFLPVP